MKTLNSHLVRLVIVAVVTNTLVVSLAAGLPVVDKGVFVITGVKTCGLGSGYCILGGDCSVDKEFKEDSTGHCDGLRKAFTPRAFFVCCSLAGGSPPSINDRTSTTTTTTVAPANSSSIVPLSIESVESVEEGEETSTESPESLEFLNNRNNGSIVVSEEEEEVVVTTVPSTTTTILASSSTESVTTPLGEPETTTTPTPTTSKAPSQADFYASLCANNLHEPTTGASSRFDRIAAQGVARDPPSNCYTAAITRTPHSTSFQDPGSFLCVGALVAPNLVLTTATCVSRLFGQDLKGFKVVLNSDVIVHPMFGYTTGATYRDIEELAIHEEYGVKSGGFFLRVNDIAVVKLAPEEGNNNSTSSCSVCLPFAQPSGHVWRDCVVSGYSHPTSMTAEPSSSTLHSAAQFIETDKANCETAIENYSPGSGGKLRTEHLNDEQDTLVCASGVEKAEACFSPRDAGSPLVCRNDRGDYALVGLFSSGFHCGTKELPVLYTNVGLFESWVGRFLGNPSSSSSSSKK